MQRIGYRVAHAGLRAWWFVRRPRTRGVKCIVRDGERALFVRHTYGNRGAWELPGGNLRRREDPAAAARREMSEELGIELTGLREVARIEISGYHKRTDLRVFTAPVPPGAALRLAPAEIAEARWAPLGAPPQPLGPDAEVLLRALHGSGGGAD